MKFIQSITSLGEARHTINALPEGTTSDTSVDDLENGNFDVAHFVKPDGDEIDVIYIGPTADEVTICSFNQADRWAVAALNRLGIAYRTLGPGFEVDFPRSVRISNDVEDAYSQPSEWRYQVGEEVFVYPLNTERLTWQQVSAMPIA